MILAKWNIPLRSFFDLFSLFFLYFVFNEGSIARQAAQ